jgi:hypothetical protein
VQRLLKSIGLSCTLQEETVFKQRSCRKRKRRDRSGNGIRITVVPPGMGAKLLRPNALMIFVHTEPSTVPDSTNVPLN